MTRAILASVDLEYKSPAIPQSHIVDVPLALNEADDLAVCLLDKLCDLVKIAAWQLAEKQEADHAW